MIFLLLSWVTSETWMKMVLVYNITLIAEW